MSSLSNNIVVITIVPYIATSFPDLFGISLAPSIVMDSYKVNPTDPVSFPGMAFP